MDPLLFAIAVPAAFTAGVLFHKYVISEAQSIKAHVSAEVATLRNDVKETIGAIAAKV